LLPAFHDHWVPFSQMEELHDLRVDPDNPTTYVLGLRLQDPQELVIVAHRARPLNGIARKMGSVGKALLDLHLDRLRGGRRLLLGEADLEDPVLQLRVRLLRDDLRGEVEDPPVPPEGPLAEVVLLVLLVPLATDLRADLQALRGRLDLDLVLRDPRQLRGHDELRALVTDVDRGNADSVLEGQGGPGPRGQGPPELPADVIEPAVHVRERAERVRRASPEGEALARLR